MILADFEKVLLSLGLELISVDLRNGKVRKALAVEKVGKRKCRGYIWCYGCCRRSFVLINYARIKEDHALFEAKAPFAWCPYSELNFLQLKKYL